MMRLIVLFALAGTAQSISPVMKVVELLDECKAKVAKDLAAEATAMEEYATFCDDELKDKAYAIETAASKIGDLEATIADAQATIAETADEITTLGTVIAGKNKELYDAGVVRKDANADFVAAEKELLTTVDQLSRAGALIKKEMSFAQGKFRVQKIAKQLKPMTAALSQIVEAARISAGSRKTMKSFLQAVAAAKESEDDDLSLDQPQAKMVAYESSSGGIVTAIEEMQGKAEDTLSDLRKKEMQGSHSYSMVKGALEGEIKNSEDKLSTAKSSNAGATEAEGSASAELVETTKTKAADEAYSKTLKTDCETKASEWEERQKSASEEMAVIEKAKDILTSGVKAFVQVKINTKNSNRNGWSPNDEDEDDKTAERRDRLVSLLKNLGDKHHSYPLQQISSMARSDPFVKIRGLIEDMIAKLLKEAQEEATQKAFCDEEMGKSKKSQDEKQSKIDEYQTRIDKASTTIATLTEEVKTLEAEVAEIDKAQAEATALRTKENTDYVKASTDFRDSAQAVAKAIEVLKNYYEGSFIQVSTKENSKSKQPDFGSAKGDTAHTIIAVLEMSEEDFTKLLAEAEATEDEAAKAYTTLTDENKVSKAAKMADSKGKQSEIKSLSVMLEHSKEDHASVSKELDAVLSYIDKLKPQCEEKAMSYAEKKAKREAEIEGLKEALGILEGGLALVQQHNFLAAKH
jgi:chromosome segregation ATPase